jgi:dihydropteroate synthase
VTGATPASPAVATVPGAAGRVLDLAHGPVVMGILNATPDSFSDGGALAAGDRVADPSRAADAAAAMAEAGAAIVDVGGESTRPGAEPVGAAEEIDRVAPVIEAVRARSEVLISVDTSKAAVARAAVAAGAHFVNDVSALRADPAMGAAVAETGAGVILMHMRGEPRTMQDAPCYDDVVAEVIAELADALDRARAAGIPAKATLVDPGIGFGKNLEHNLTLLRRIGELRRLGRPIVLGVSRKSFLGRVTGIASPRDRMPGSIAVAALAAAEGVEVLRVHDVAETVQAVRAAVACAPTRERQQPEEA